MLKIDATYSDYREDSDPDFPYGKAVPTTTPGSTDGTPWLDTWFNDLNGARQALFVKAFAGSGRTPSNAPDNIENSDVLDSILKIIQDSFSSKLFVFEISGTDAVIDWADLGITYDANKTYCAIATPQGNYEEFLPFGTECKNDGLHIYPRRFENGKIVPGTRHVKWGTRKWGIGKWNDYESMKINLQFQEVIPE